MARFKVLLAVVMVLALTLTAFGCAAPTPPAPSAAPDVAAPSQDAAPGTDAPPAPPAELIKVTFGFSAAQPSQTHTPFFVARELGYWEEEGIDANFEWTSGSSQSIQLLSAGQIDFSAANHDTLIFAVQKGATLKAVFQEHTKCEFVFAVAKDSPIKTFEDLKGKSIGVSSLSSGFISFAKAALFEAGMDPEKDMTFIEVGSGATAATAISTKQVDALGLWEVAFAGLENTLGEDYFDYIIPPIYDRLACNAVMTSDAFINEHPEALAGFLRGLAKGTLFMQTNPEAAISIFFKNVPEAKPQDKDEATIMKEAMHTAQSENVQRSNMNRPQQNPNGLWGFLVESEFTEAQDVNVQMGILTEKLAADQYMTNQFSDAINDFDSAAIIKQAQEYTVQ